MSIYLLIHYLQGYIFKIYLYIHHYINLKEQSKCKI
jgi:hypothetical protein